MELRKDSCGYEGYWTVAATSGIMETCEFAKGPAME